MEKSQANFPLGRWICLCCLQCEWSQKEGYISNSIFKRLFLRQKDFFIRKSAIVIQQKRKKEEEEEDKEEEEKEEKQTAIRPSRF